MTDWDMFLVVYGVIVVLAVLTAILTLQKFGNKKLAWALVGLYAVIAMEQVYYGVGRYWPELYETLTWFAPGVMALKALYCAALAAIVRKLLLHKGVAS